jgi:hypothetical protein
MVGEALQHNRRVRMKQANYKLFYFLILAVVSISLISKDASSQFKKKKDPVSSPTKKLAYPLPVWSKVFTSEIIGVDIAERTGAVVVSSSNKIYYFQDSAKPLWTAGKKTGWKHIQDLDISSDGSKIFFQTDIKQKKQTESKSLTVHILDQEGNELIAAPNPYRYQNAIFSPRGSYLIFGELMHRGVKLHDHNMNLIWEKPLEFWYLAFDPGEKYIFDGKDGKLYSASGEQVWEFGPYTKILSVSDDAEIVMTQYYLLMKETQKMFLMGRLQLRKIELMGNGGAVSPDGTMCAYVDPDRNLVVYRTKELLSAGSAQIPPLFKTKFGKPISVNISRDNRTLFVMGKESEYKSQMMLVDLEKMKISWRKKVPQTMKTAIPTENNKFVIAEHQNNMIVKYKCY